MSELPEDQAAFDTQGLRFMVNRRHPQFVEVRRVADGAPVDQIPAGRPVDIADIPSLAARWIDERLGAAVPPPTLCRSCGVELVSVFGRDTDTQFQNALVVTFSGGYGMFYDALAVAPTAILCGRCATHLCEEHPWIAEMLELDDHWVAGPTDGQVHPTTRP